MTHVNLVHHIVLGKKTPRFNRECLDSWHALANRGFELVTWTDRTIADYLVRCPLPGIRGLYDRARNCGEASDILRMAITYTYGGLYVDWDVMLVDPDGFLRVMPELNGSRCVLVRDPYTREPSFSCAYDNSLFYMAKGNRLALDFLGAMASNYEKRPVPNTPYLTGPLALTCFLDARPDHMQACHTIDMREIYAFDYEEVIGRTRDQTDREILRDQWSQGAAPAIHFWTHSWSPKRGWPRRAIDKAVRTFRTAAGVD